MKRLLTLALGLTLIVGTLSGCSKTEPNSGQNEAKPETKTEAPAGEDKKEETPAENDGWQAIGTADSPVQVKIVIKDVLPDEEDVLLMEEVIESKMAAHGQYIDLVIAEPPAGSYASALPLAFRGGEVDADIIYFQGGDTPITQEGLLLDLTDYINNSTYVKSIMEPAGTARIANYPYLLWLAPARVSVPVIRKDWAEKLTTYETLMADPTIDNYYNFFKEIKESGLATYALTADGGFSRWDSVFNQAFGVTATIVQDENGKYVFSKSTDAEKNKLAWYAKLYAEGLIDPDYLTNSWDIAEQKFYEGKVGIYVGTNGATVKIYNDKMVSVHGNEAELVVLPPAKGVGFAYAAVDTTKEPRGFGINADSKNPDAAFAFLDFMASPEGRMIDKLGIEGTHYTVENNKIVFTDKFPNWWSRIWETTYGFEPEMELAQPLYPQAAEDSLTMADEYYAEDRNILTPEELLPVYDGMNTIYLEYATDIITGNIAPEAFDEFKTKWEEAGADMFTSYFEEAFK